MKLMYIANARLPSEKAHPYQILKMCQAFKKLGVDVSLAVPYRVQTSPQMRNIKDIWKYYGINTRFSVRRLPSIDLLWLDRYWISERLDTFISRLQMFSFAIFGVIYAVSRKADLYYTRDFYVAFILSLLNKLAKKRVFYESHTSPGPIAEKLEVKMLKNIDGLIVITEKLKQSYIKAGVPEEKILVAPDGVDLEMFANTILKEEARKALGISLNKRVICYIGHLYDWKGAHILASSMKKLPSNCICYFVGGTNKDIGKFREFIENGEISNIVIVGHVPPPEIPKFLAASDVLILPLIKTRFSEYASPLKLFEYMASKRPIVASDLPSIREILSEENAVLVEPGNPEALAKGITRVLNDEELACKLAENAYKDVQQHTWEKRAETILGFIGDEHE